MRQSGDFAFGVPKVTGLPRRAIVACLHHFDPHPERSVPRCANHPQSYEESFLPRGSND